MADHEVLHGDALELAASLPRAAVQLLYIDPPFFSGRQRRHREGGYGFDDRWPGGLTEYLSFLRRLIEVTRPLLRETGLIALHLDWRASHHGRIELERAYGASAFVNEIVWSYRTGGLSRRRLARKHDTILVFARGHEHTFNLIRDKSYVAHRYGFGNVEIEQDEGGYFTRTARRDVWDVPALRGNQIEYEGFPTQKPLALLTRLIECFSDAGDLVADLCCGSGTTLCAAKALGRRSLGCDVSADAVRLARRRLKA